MMIEQMRAGQWFWNHRINQPMMRIVAAGKFNVVSYAGIALYYIDNMTYKLMSLKEVLEWAEHQS